MCRGCPGRLVVHVLFPSKGPDTLLGRKIEEAESEESFRLSRQRLDSHRKGTTELDTGPYAGEEGNKRRKEDLQSWKRIAIGRLSRLRVGELPDIVVEWPESLGGIDDQKVWEQLPKRVSEFALILISPTSCPPNPHVLGPKLLASPLSSYSSGCCIVRYSPGLYLSYTGFHRA